MVRAAELASMGRRLLRHRRTLEPHGRIRWARRTEDVQREQRDGGHGGDGWDILGSGATSGGAQLAQRVLG